MVPNRLILIIAYLFITNYMITNCYIVTIIVAVHGVLFAADGKWKVLFLFAHAKADEGRWAATGDRAGWALSVNPRGICAFSRRRQGIILRGQALAHVQRRLADKLILHGQSTAAVVPITRVPQFQTLFLWGKVIWLARSWNTQNIYPNSGD